LAPGWGHAFRATLLARRPLRVSSEAAQPIGMPCLGWGSVAFTSLAAVGLAFRGGLRRRSVRRGCRKPNGPRFTALCSSLGSDDNAKTALEEFNAFDADGDGVITRQEFIARRVAKRPFEEELVTRSESFKRYLIEQEEAGPLWYRLSDGALTALGTVCFVTSVVEPQVADTYHLGQVEDIVNVSFLVKFMLLFWTNDFEVGWMFTGKGALDLASCLPVLAIPARFLAGPGLARTTDLLQIGRFLRLLRDALPSDLDAVRAGTAREVPLSQQILAVILSLLGTVVVSSTVLFSFENPTELALRERSFEDALVYMVNIFAGRDPPWYPVRPQAKIASAVATCCAIIFIPFLISRTVELFMAPFSKYETQSAAAEADTVDSSWTFANWITLLKRLDMLVESCLISAGDAKQLRNLCLEKNYKIKMIDQCYGEACSTAGEEPLACQLYASRLKELIHEHQDCDNRNLPPS